MEELAQQYFDTLPERAGALLDRLEEEADETAQTMKHASSVHDLSDPVERRGRTHDAFKRGATVDGGKPSVARLAIFGRRVTDTRHAP